MEPKEAIANIIVIVFVLILLVAAYFVGKYQIDSQKQYESDLSDAKYHVYIESKNITTTENLLKSIDSNCEAYVQNQYIDSCVTTLRHDFIKNR